MASRHVEMFTDSLTGKDIPDGQHQEVLITIGGVTKLLDLDSVGKLFGQLAEAHDKGEKPRDKTNVVPFQRKAPTGTATPRIDREQNKAMRVWAQKHVNGLAARGRIPQSVQDAYHAQDPTKLPGYQAPTATSVSVSMTEGGIKANVSNGSASKAVPAKRTATKAEAKAG